MIIKYYKTKKGYITFEDNEKGDISLYSDNPTLKRYIKSMTDKKFNEWVDFFKKYVNLDFLQENGKLIETALEGTCQLWELESVEYVVLCDNTVITRAEDNADNDAIFPY
jgi:hypothetical protein